MRSDARSWERALRVFVSSQAVDRSSARDLIAARSAAGTEVEHSPSTQPGRTRSERGGADEILIYGTSLGIVIPFVLEMLAFHYLTNATKQFWTHASLIFTILYAVFVSTNYVVQLATVIPATLAGTSEAIRVLKQTPHSLLWDFDALGYISMGLANLVALPALSYAGIEKWVKLSSMANALVTPLISVVYFYPTYSSTLLFLGFPWAITAPLFMILLAILLRRRSAAHEDVRL